MSGTIDNMRFRKLLLAFPGKAIEFLYEHYYHSLVNISMTLTHNQKVSEDIVQETFVDVWEKHNYLGKHHERSIEHYLVRVVKNKSITFYKNNLKNNDFKVRYSKSNNSSHQSIETTIIEMEINTRIREYISTFPRREKECLLMKIDEEMTVQQIADTLKISKKAVERSLTSANKRLRKYPS